MSVLTRYRGAQGALRDWFDPFTAAHCPGCPTPCCRKPTQVAPFDVVLVEELGYVLPHGGQGVGEWLVAARDGAPAESATVAGVLDPCDYLGPTGCAFPPDLRPFGCAVDICIQMRLHADDAWLAEAERRADRLHRAHRSLLAALNTEPTVSDRR
jgi:hypothetical protein